MGIRYSDEWGAWELAKVRYGKKQGKYVEYVLSQKEWDELQARIEELEAKNARFKKALQKILSNSHSYPNLNVNYSKIIVPINSSDV